ncbi:MAG TPA: heavy metal-associated domain-containing protein [Bacteriovoracaceae bacterium]|nr:heavy metal-associated domain-containing protein [Bacteriovoracaceae bacterium]
MKKILVALLMVSSLTSWAESIKVEVNGMVCSMCAQGIEKKFKKMDVVKSIKVDLDTKVVHIELLENQTLDDEVVRKNIVDSGYNVAKITRE